VGTHLDHHATRCVTVEAEGLVSTALQDGGRGRLEARFRDARMVLLDVLLRAQQKTNIKLSPVQGRLNITRM
jgi:hypothetical protein